MNVFRLLRKMDWCPDHRNLIINTLEKWASAIDDMGELGLEAQQQRALISSALGMIFAEKRHPNLILYRPLWHCNCGHSPEERVCDQCGAVLWD